MQARSYLIEDETALVGIASAAMYLYTLRAYQAKEALQRKPDAQRRSDRFYSIGHA
jgi:hypothetical protein